MAAFIRPRPTAAGVDCDDVSRLPANGGRPDRAFGNGVTMLFSSSFDGRYCMATVLAHEVEHIGAVKRPSLAVRVRMPAPTHTEMHETKEDVHESPIRSARSLTVMQSARLCQRMNGQNARNFLAVPTIHSSLSWRRP